MHFAKTAYVGEKSGSQVMAKNVLGKSDFSEKILIQGKWAILGLKTARAHNFGSALRIFLKFCTMERVKRYMEIIIVFLKKFSFEANGPFCFYSESGTLS